eukprot:tig00020556_g11048.t1
MAGMDALTDRAGQRGGLERLLHPDDSHGLHTATVAQRAPASNIISISGEKLVEEPVSAAQLEEFCRTCRKREQRFWLDVECPTVEQMQGMESAFGLHPVTAEDCFQSDTIDKVEFFDEYIFVCFRDLVLDPSASDSLRALAVNVVVFDNGVLSFHASPTSAFSHVLARTRRLQRTHKSGQRQLPSGRWLCYAFLDAIVDRFVPLVAEVVEEVRSLDDLVLLLGETDEAEVVLRIAMARRRAAALRDLLQRKRDVLSALLIRMRSDRQAGAEAGSPPQEDITVYLRDVRDHVRGMLRKLERARETLLSLQSSFHAKISHEIAVQTEGVAGISKTAGLIGVILMWHFLVCSVLSMNVNIPWQKTDDGAPLGAFYGVLGEMGASTLAFCAIAKWRKWV